MSAALNAAKMASRQSIWRTGAGGAAAGRGEVSGKRASPSSCIKSASRTRRGSVRPQRRCVMFGAEHAGTGVETVAHIIQAALMPVFLLSGIATLLNVFSTRLARVADQV